MRPDADTVKAADRLLELALKMADALTAGDRNTARAMWQTLQRELSDAARREPANPGRFQIAKTRFMAITGPLDLTDTAEAAIEFWRGFHDGLKEATMRNRGTEAYQAGYRSGNHKIP